VGVALEWSGEGFDEAGERSDMAVSPGCDERLFAAGSHGGPGCLPMGRRAVAQRQSEVVVIIIVIVAGELAVFVFFFVILEEAFVVLFELSAFFGFFLIVGKGIVVVIIAKVVIVIVTHENGDSPVRGGVDIGVCPAVSGVVECLAAVEHPVLLRGSAGLVQEFHHHGPPAQKEKDSITA
jgi:hypothetical protein